MQSFKNKKSRILKLLLSNLIILLFLSAVLEACLYFSFKKVNPRIKYDFQTKSYADIITNKHIRMPVGLEYTGRPLILFGCSVMYGLYLDDFHTPHYKLSEITERPVYNIALPGKGIQHTLYILQNRMFLPDIKNPEYAFFVMIDDHLKRMYLPVSFMNISEFLEYRMNSDGSLDFISDKYPSYKKFLLHYHLSSVFCNIFNIKYSKKSEKLCFAYFKAINLELKKIYPDIKFVVLLYDNGSNFGFDFSKLENEGITVINAKDLTGVNLLVPEYQLSPTDAHPSEKAWDVIIPKLVKKLNL